ncbi:lipid-A-disaccharide synthase [Desulfacinum hydrothermale DSM 13146]|uniref:Lipid-A-disaccharide synthase n=1 Tax=Desulfacinum hydrothermale DSM 13146 TaxID=1121390 RepID=A0A1W1XVA3_9BACT|nr:lipid-A-disaccharide synthase [Desulfacinum hydrothermale]SMC27817.1 lipid-A-disaccharide synthase [Desulfacinum hydrothermale DSM 13146]
MKIFVSAGEASGDLHASSLVRAMRREHPHLQVSCLGGPRLEEAGARILVDNRDLSLIGVLQVLPKARTLYGAWRTLRNHLVSKRPDLVVLVDFPDFNFLLGRLAHRLGLKVFYYISPQVWAWRRGRIRSLKRFVDTMAVILPFEEAFYRRHGMRVHYVGHPLADTLAHVPDKAACRKALGLDGETHTGSRSARTVCLLPGSRRGEVRTFLPLLLDAARRLYRRHGDLQFLLAAAAELDPSSLPGLGSFDDLPLRIVHGDTHRALRACDLAVAVSGTVTLEAALLGTPLVIVYKVSPIEYHAGRFLIRVPFIGLPNLVAERRIYPELLQEDASPERIAGEVERLLTQPRALEEQRSGLREIARRVGGPGAARRAARIALSLCVS